MKKIENLSVLFDGPPSAEQLTKEFGKDGWQLVSLLPVNVASEQEGQPPEQKLQAYFIREDAAAIMVPLR